MDVHYSWELKRQKSFFILYLIKIIFVRLFFSILLFSNCASLRQNNLNSLNSLKLTLNSLKLSPLCLTAVGLTQSSTSLAHWSLMSPTHQLTHFVKLPTQPKPQAANSLLRPTAPIRRRSMPLIHLGLLWCSQLSQTHSLKLSPLCPAAAAANPRLRLDSPSSELSLSSSSTCLGFFIWVIGTINL